MKALKITAIFLIFTSLFQGCAQEKKMNLKPTNMYNIVINSLTGEKIDLNQFKGKKILFVNVASECGFTPQYKDLQKLNETYKDKLVVIGLPCNQFGEQESGTPAQIKSFCEKNYGVDFLMTEKIDVKGENQHPLYAWLTQKEMNGVMNSSVKWNFQKYLVDENGKLIDVFYSITEPLNNKIVKLL
jgi:glutathione peroxidase